MVAVGRVGGEHLDLPDEELLLVRAELVPRLQHVLRPGRELRVLPDHAETLLVVEDPLAQLLVAIVEQMHRADLLDPLLRRMVRRMRRARRVLDEERLVRIGLVQPRHPVDRVVGHARDEVPTRLALERVDLRGIAEEVRLPLVGVTADEAIEVLEAHARGPVVERTGLAGGEGRHVVVLAEPGRRIAIVEQDSPDRGLVLAKDAVVAGEAGRLLRDHAEAGRVMVAPGDQRGPRRRAQCGGEHPIVAEAFSREAVHGRRRDDAAEGAGDAEAGVVGDDQQHVGRTRGRHDARRPPGCRLQGSILDHAAELRVGRWELLAADARRRAGRSQRAGDLLRGARCRAHQRYHENSTERDRSRRRSHFPASLVAVG